MERSRQLCRKAFSEVVVGYRRQLCRSSLSASFNCPVSKNSAAGDPVGLFGNGLLKEARGLKLLTANVRSKCAEIVKNVLDGERRQTTVMLFDDISDLVCQGADLTECMRHIHPNSEYVKSAEECSLEFADIVESLNTHRPIYEALKQSKETESSQLDAVDRRVLQMFVDDMELSGIHLSPEKCRKFVALSQEVLNAGIEFSRGAHQSVNVSFLERKQYGINNKQLNRPFDDAQSGALRRWAYKKFFAYAPLQEERLINLIRCRNDLAKLTGFDSYADRAQKYTLFASAQQADDFLVALIQELKSSAEREMSVLRDMADQFEIDKLYQWDIPYLMGVYRRSRFLNRDSPEKYLSLGSVFDGFNQLISRLYGIHLKEMSVANGEVWSENVRKLAVYRDEIFLGTVYCDLECRENKMGGDCHYTVRCPKQIFDGTYQTPIVVLAFNLSMREKPVLLTPNQAEDIFHELGHAVHSMLARTKYQHVAGTRCSTDMAEIPSNLMEYFFYDARVLREIAFDDCTNEVMPLETIHSLISSRWAFAALETTHQAVNALFDIRLHGRDAELIVQGRFSTGDLYRSILNFALPQLETDPHCAWHHRFTHLYAYGARYYSYLVAKASASLIWNTKFNQDPFSRCVGERWGTVQSFGGEKPSSDLLAMILGFTPTTDHLVCALYEEIKSKSCF